MTDCVHWWVIESVGDGERHERLSGVCKHCGLVRTFSAAFNTVNEDGKNVFWRGRRNSNDFIDEYATDSPFGDNSKILPFRSYQEETE